MNNIIHRDNPAAILRKPMLTGLLATALTLASAMEAGADTIQLTDYYQTEAVGASWNYRIQDRGGQVVGDLSEEVIEEESNGFFRSELVSNFGEMVGTATFWKRFNAAGEEIVAGFDFETQYDGMVIDSSSTDFGDPTENFSSLSLGDEATISTSFTEVSQGFDGQQQNRSGTTEIKVTFEGYEEVEVPAGTFDTVRIKFVETMTYDDAPQMPETDTQIHWYAQGIGRVQKVFPESDPEDVHYRDELTAYSLPDDPQDPEDGFTSWVDSHDLPEGEDAPDSNPSGDGIPNAMKYALGLDPNVAARDQLPAEEVFESDQENYLAIQVDLTDAAEDVTFTVEFSDDLKDWESEPEDVTVVEDNDSVLHVRDNKPVSTTTERFARLRVELGE